MNSLVELGLKNFLAAGDRLNASALVVGSAPAMGEPDERITVLAAAALGGSRASLHCFISKDAKPENLPWILCAARDIKSVVGPLYDAETTIAVATPQLIHGIDESVHRAIVSAVRAAFVMDNLSALSDALLAAANCTCGGFFVDDMFDSLGDTRWQTDIKIKIGLHEQL